MKKFVILRNGGGELANQLWNYASIYAYALSVGATVRNPSFFEYHRAFNLLPGESFMTRLMSLPFGRTRRRGHLLNRAGRLLYGAWAKLTASRHRGCLLSSQNSANAVVYLPPTRDLAASACDTTYFEGWLFRNPAGLARYRAELLRAFAPAPRVARRVEALLAPLRAARPVVLGVHIRQGDYRTFKGGRYLISPARMRAVVDEYVATRALSPEQVALFIASDGPVDPAAFAGYEAHISREDAVVDLFALSGTNAVVGSDSSFGNFAAWYGDIPHVVASTGPIDWPYYAGKDRYFENRYATLVPLGRSPMGEAR